MRIPFTTILTTSLGCHLFAATAAKELDPQLLRIFEQMQTEGRAEELEGQKFSANLTVKLATEKFLIFSDAYLQDDEETKYQIAKWNFDSEEIVELNAKRDDVVTVNFEIEETRTESPYADMPHFVATIISIAHSKKQPDQGGAINSERLRSSP
jgi:hypothetical protein